MADAEIVKSRLKAIIDYYNEIGNGRTVVRKDVLNDAMSVIEEQQGRIDHMLSLLGEADREKERLKEEIELLKAQNRPGFGG